MTMMSAAAVTTMIMHTIIMTIMIMKRGMTHMHTIIIEHMFYIADESCNHPMNAFNRNKGGIWFEYCYIN